MIERLFQWRRRRQAMRKRELEHLLREEGFTTSDAKVATAIAWRVLR